MPLSLLFLSKCYLAFGPKFGGTLKKTLQTQTTKSPHEIKQLPIQEIEQSTESDSEVTQMSGLSSKDFKIILKLC